MAQLSPLLDHYLAEHARVERELPGADNDMLQVQRKQALARFVDAGFPGARDEHWKYSDTRPLQKHSFELAGTQPLTAAQIDQFMPTGLDVERIVFVNGHYNAELSDRDDTLSVALRSGDTPSRQTGDDESIQGEHAFIAMNRAFAADGACLKLPENHLAERPIYLLFVGAPTDEAQMLQIRNQIDLGRNAQATVIEHYVSLGDTGYFNNCVTRIELAENAQLTRIRLQTESSQAMQVGATFADLKRDSRLSMHSVDLGGRWLRYDSNIRLTEPGAEVHLNGLYVPTKRQHMDNHTCVDHLAPHCISREDYKGILNDGARGVFNGRIVVHKDAQKTDSEQSSAALLLSGKAEVDAKPELEIYADDVKCKHGATVGQLDDSAIFYLQSRGLSETEARNILTYSFADELVHRIGIEPLQKVIEAQLLAKLPQGESLEELL